MKDRNNIDALKQLFVEHSKPNADSIKGKIEFNINSDRRTVFADILVRTRVRNSLIVLIALVLVAAIALSVVFTVDFTSNSIIENPVNEPKLQYFNEINALWVDNFNAMYYNSENGTAIKKFHNYVEVISEYASNIDGFFRMFYEGIKDETIVNISMFVHLDNKLSKKYENYTTFADTMKWNNGLVRFKSEVSQLGQKNTYNVFYFDKVYNVNYIIDISYMGIYNSDIIPLEYFLEDLRVA